MLLTDKMKLILPTITGIRSGKTDVVLTRPSNTKLLFLLAQLLSGSTHAAAGPGSVMLWKLFPVENAEIYIFLLPLHKYLPYGVVIYI